MILSGEFDATNSVEVGAVSCCHVGVHNCAMCKRSHKNLFI